VKQICIGIEKLQMFSCPACSSLRIESGRSRLRFGVYVSMVGRSCQQINRKT